MQILKDLIPVSTNLKIINLLLESKNWYIAIDKKSNKFEDFFSREKKNLGFTMLTYCRTKEIKTDNLELNLYADLILDNICEKLKIKNFNIERIMWNLYFSSDEGDYHVDNYESNFLSVLYSLHTTDGGIILDNNFINDKQGEAKVFKSSILHKGVGPTKDKVRFNLNMVFSTF
jgi:hypothetical protein